MKVIDVSKSERKQDFFNDLIIKACNGKTLFECYKRPSQAKMEAYNRCLELRKKHNITELGESFKRARCGGIVSYNCQTFAFAFLGEYNGVGGIFFITKNYDRFYHWG